MTLQDLIYLTKKMRKYRLSYGPILRIFEGIGNVRDTPMLSLLSNTSPTSIPEDRTQQNVTTGSRHINLIKRLIKVS